MLGSEANELISESHTGDRTTEARYCFRGSGDDRGSVAGGLWQEDAYQVRDQATSEESLETPSNTGSAASPEDTMASELWDAQESTLTAAATVLTAGARNSSLSIVPEDEDPDPTDLAQSIAAKTSFDDALCSIVAGGGLSSSASTGVAPRKVDREGRGAGQNAESESRCTKQETFDSVWDVPADVVAQRGDDSSEAHENKYNKKKKKKKKKEEKKRPIPVGDGFDLFEDAQHSSGTPVHSSELRDCFAADLFDTSPGFQEGHEGIGSEGPSYCPQPGQKKKASSIFDSDVEDDSADDTIPVAPKPTHARPARKGSIFDSEDDDDSGDELIPVAAGAPVHPSMVGNISDSSSSDWDDSDGPIAMPQPGAAQGESEGWSSSDEGVDGSADTGPPMEVIQEGSWTIYVVMVPTLELSTVTPLDGTVLVELGHDFQQCFQVDPSGSTAQMFRSVKVDEARALVSTAGSRPSVEATIRGNQRVKELRAAEVAQEKAHEEQAALEAPVREEVRTWRAGRISLQELLLGLPEIVPDAAQAIAADLEKLRQDRSLVARTYKKALLRLHPDKLQHLTSPHQRMLSVAVFDELKVAYDRHKAA